MDYALFLLVTAIMIESRPRNRLRKAGIPFP
jgi:hypothetical protein